MEEEEEEEEEEEKRGAKGGKGLPRGTVARLAKAAAGKAVLSAEVQTALVASCNLFVGRLTGAARQQGSKRQKKGSGQVPMIGEKDVEDACNELGFDFSAELDEVAAEIQTKKKSTKLRRSQQSAIPPEERARLQVRSCLAGLVAS